jgi:hypothetical protein
MPLDPSIILGAKQPQFDMAQFSPMNALAAAAKFKQADQESQLNAFTLKQNQELQDFMAKNPDLKSDDSRTALASRFGKPGREIVSSLTGISAADTNEAKRKNDLVVSKSALYRDALRDVTDQRSALQWIQDQKNDPDMAGSPIANVSIMDAASKIPADPAGFAQWRQQAALGLGEYIKQNKPTVVGSSSSVYDPVSKTFVQAPAAPAAPVTPLNVSRLIKERDALLPGDPNIAIYNDAIRKETQFAPRAVTNVNMPSQEKAEQVDRGKMLVAEYGEISKAAKLASKIC